ncbi:MAG: T9SS type A sorting domain-containing protein [Bacteroidetes bacterium]|nr:T9SS type A sorting domain-containing protein [Bacteroidota bacterium]
MKNMIVMRRLSLIPAYFCCISSIFSQLVNFEEAIQAAYRCQINRIAYQSDGGYITAGYTINDEYSGNTSLSRYDSVGNSKWVLNTIVPSMDIGPLSDMINSGDSNIVLTSYVTPCDIGTPAGFVTKCTRSGKLIWKLKFKGDLISAPRPNHIKELRSGKLIVSSDSSIYCISEIGDSLWSVKYNHGIIYSTEENLSKELIIGTSKGVIRADSNGVLLNFYSFQSPVKNIISANDSTYFITTGTSILKLNTVFVPMKTLDLSTKYAQLNLLRKSNYGLWIAGIRKSDSAPLIAKVDSSTLLYLYDFSFVGDFLQVYDMNIDGKKIVVAGIVAGFKNNHQFIKSFDYLGNCTKQNTDIGITDMKLDTAYLYRIPSWPTGYHFINFKPLLTLKNFGSTTISSFAINTSFYLATPICGTSTYTHKFDTIILPGDSIMFHMPLLSDGFIYSTGGNVNYSNLCLWTSVPNNKIDIDHSNDSYCTSFSVPVSINEIFPLDEYIKVFPNPTYSNIQLSTDPQFLNRNLSFQLFDIAGQVVETGPIIKNLMEITLPEDKVMYLLKITDKNHTRQIKLIKN